MNPQPIPIEDLDKAISGLPPCLLEIPDDEEYAKGLAGQIHAVPITQDTRKAIKSLIQTHTSQLEATLEERERLARVAELKEVMGDGTLHHYRIVRYINNRISALQKDLLDKEQL